MTEESFNGLVDSLRNVQPASSPAKIASKVAPAAEGLPEATITDILGALLSLYSARSLNEIDIPEFVDDLGRAMASAKSSGPTDVDLFKRRFAVLLDIPSLAISAKAFSIQREQQRIFISARSFSDVRPVFSEDGEHPIAAIVLHQLKLSYVEDDARKELFVTLDDEDLSKLQKILTRAQTKSKALAGLIEKTGLAKLG